MTRTLKFAALVVSCNLATFAGMAAAQVGTVEMATSINVGSMEVTDGQVLAGVILNRGRMAFSDGASAGSATIENHGEIVFLGRSTADDARIVNHGVLRFEDDSRAGAAAIANLGTLEFQDRALADTAQLKNDGTLFFVDASDAVESKITNAGTLYFYIRSTAGRAQLVNSGEIFFRDDSVAGHAHVDNSGLVDFSDRAGAEAATFRNRLTLLLASDSTAGMAQIENAGTLTIAGHAEAGLARVTNSAPTSLVDLSGAEDGVAEIGALEGAGTVWLGFTTLVIGGAGGDAVFRGVIQDGHLGPEGWVQGGGSLIKTGPGTHRLEAPAYTGSTVVNDGGLILGTIAEALTLSAGSTLLALPSTISGPLP